MTAPWTHFISACRELVSLFSHLYFVSHFIPAPANPYFISPALPDAPVPPVPPGARYLLSQHPEVEARVVAELDALELLVTLSRPAPRELEWADLGRLTYLQAVIKARQALV